MLQDLGCLAHQQPADVTGCSKTSVVLHCMFAPPLLYTCMSQACCSAHMRLGGAAMHPLSQMGCHTLQHLMQLIDTQQYMCCDKGSEEWKT